MKFSLCCIFGSLIFCFSAVAGIIEVPADQLTIQAGIHAAVDGDTVLVAEGTWFENINFKGKAITVASHYLIDGDSSHIALTVIDGSQPSHPDSGSVVFFISGEDTTSILHGFTITAGSGTITEYSYLGSNYVVRAGGAVFCFGSGARISSNIIMHNIISFDFAGGAGISVLPTPNDVYIIVEDNQIIENVVSGEITQAAAVETFISGRIVNNLISMNTTLATEAGFGPIGCWSDVAPHSVLIKNNMITNNLTNAKWAYAGAMQIELAMSAVIIGNTISENLLNGENLAEGGAIRLLWKSVPDTIESNTITNNIVHATFTSEYAGGIMLRDNEDSGVTVITNNILAGNSARLGGGIRCEGSRAELMSNTIVNNAASNSGGGISVLGLSEVIIVNAILWGNTAPADAQIFKSTGSSVAVHYCDVQDGWEGETNIDADPLFEDMISFRLTDGSPCIGAGIDFLEIDGTMYNCPPADIEGTSRPFPAGSNPDIGARESKLAVSGIEPQPVTQLPKTYTLSQNYPNPFNPETVIEFELPGAAMVTLQVFNVLGEEAAGLVSEQLAAGKYKYSWNAVDLPSGLYLYRLTVNDERSTLFTRSRKMLLVR